MNHDELQQAVSQNSTNTHGTHQMPQTAPSPITAKVRTCQSLDQCFEQLDRAEMLLADEAGESARRPYPLSVVIPVFNEVKTLPKVIAAVRDLPIDKQIVVVDDASTDGTTQWLHSIKDQKGIVVISRRRNRGKGSALRLGFRHCEGAIVAIQDADLEYDPADLMEVIRPIQEGLSDVAYGSRYLSGQQDPSSLHRFGNQALTFISNLTTGLRLTDMETCYKAFRHDVIAEIPLRQCRFGFEPEVTAKLARRGRRVIEVPIRYSSRSYDEGKKIGWRDAVNAVYCMLRYGYAD